MRLWVGKEPAEVVDRLFDFTADLAVGELIVTKTVTAFGVMVDSSTILGATVRVWLSGGTRGSSAIVECRVTTNSVPARTFVELALLPIGDSAVSFGQAQAHLGIDWEPSVEQAMLIATYLAAAVAAVEARAQTILAERAVVQRLDRLVDRQGRSALRLAKAPVISVEGIDFIAPDGLSTTLTLGAAQLRVVQGFPAFVVPPVDAAWPATIDGEPGAVRVRYTAGYGRAVENGGAGPAPWDLKAAVLMMVGHLYHNREAVVTGSAASELPLGVAAFCAAHRHSFL